MAKKILGDSETSFTNISSTTSRPLKEKKNHSLILFDVTAVLEVLPLKLECKIYLKTSLVQTQLRASPKVILKSKHIVRKSGQSVSTTHL